LIGRTRIATLTASSLLLLLSGRSSVRLPVEFDETYFSAP
jgi:hypothetical protein